MVKAHIPVGVEVECRPGSSRWSSHIWRAVALRPGRHAMPDWTVLSEIGDITRYYAGTASLVIRSAETALYKDNISARNPAVYVVLRRTLGPVGWKLHLVSVDPSEAQAHTEVGDDLVEALPMPMPLRDWLESFVARYHVDRTRWKRDRDAKTPDREPGHVPPDGEGFLDRWSRLKQAGQTEAVAAPASPAMPAAELAPLENLRSRTDFATFLRNELPTEVRLAALRQAWRRDVAIAGYRPLVDYDWNFNTPGYARLLPTDNSDQLVEKLFGYLRGAAGEPPPAQTAVRTDASSPDEEASIVVGQSDPHETSGSRHGSATPRGRRENSPKQ